MNSINISEFPALSQKVGSKNASLIYLDTAATSLKPQCVIDIMSDFYAHHGGAAGRGSSSLATWSDLKVDEVREHVLKFTGCLDDSNNSCNYDVIWTSGATEGLNMLASMFANFDGDIGLKNGDNIVLSRAEHHANIIPWQQAASQTGATIRYLDVLNDGTIDLNGLAGLIDDHTKVISITHCSNVTGQITDIPKLMSLLNSRFPQKEGRPVVVLDACQSVAHIPLNIAELDVDFVVFSAHKLYGPSGLGVLIGRRHLLEILPTPKTGGGMVELVEEQTTTFMPPPAKFEPGSINTAGIVGLDAALTFIESIGWESIKKHENQLIAALQKLKNIPGVRILRSFPNVDYNPDAQLTSVALASFTVDGIHPHDLGQFLDEQGIALRTGHHCAQLLHRTFGVPSSTRASCGLYTTPEDILRLIDAIEQAQEFFR